MGSILENAMAQLLKSAGFSLHYYNSAKNGEIDFAIRKGMLVDLVEVKSGADYLRHHALDKVMSVSEWDFRP